MANFDIAYNRTAKWEGGYTDNPNDLGNYNSRSELVGTNWGVSAKKYEDYLGRPPSKWEMKNMPKWQAKNIFKADEWTRMKGDTIQNQPLANIIFDGLVNHGKGTQLLQEVLGIETDNIYGPKTAEGSQ